MRQVLRCSWAHSDMNLPACEMIDPDSLDRGDALCVPAGEDASESVKTPHQLCLAANPERSCLRSRDSKESSRWVVDHAAPLRRKWKRDCPGCGVTATLRIVER